MTPSPSVLDIQSLHIQFSLSLLPEICGENRLGFGIAYTPDH